jgi:chromosomal replication initiation ATPase DnaA
MTTFKPPYQINPYTFAGIARVIERSEIDIKSIITTVCEYYGIEEAALKEKNRNRDLVKARQMCWSFLDEIGVGCVKAAKIMGGFDHTTVLHGIKTLNDVKSVTPEIMTEYNTLHAMLFRPRLQDLLTNPPAKI